MVGWLKSFFFICLTPTLLWAAVDVVSDADGKAQCEEIDAKREIRVFKDPSLFMPNLALLSEDPKAWDQLVKESPLLTSLNGRVGLMRLGKPREFKNFGAIAKLYEAAEPRLRLRENGGESGATRIIPVQLCRDGSWGFVLESDLMQASVSEDPAADDVMPPSTYPNPIPRWKELKSRDAQK